MKQTTSRRVRFCCLAVLALAACTRTAPASTAATDIASHNSPIVHRSDCKYAAKTKLSNRVPFNHLPDAIAEGYRPCKSCLPAATTAPVGVRGGQRHD